MGALKRHHECPCCGDITYEPLTGACTTCTVQLAQIRAETIAFCEEHQEPPEWLVRLENAWDNDCKRGR